MNVLSLCLLSLAVRNNLFQRLFEVSKEEWGIKKVCLRVW